jgi:PAS domain-containing protein
VICILLRYTGRDSLRASYLRNHENEIFTKHGVRRLISWSNIILFDETGKPVGTAGVGQDVTDSRRVEDALRRREEKFRQIAENVREVIWMMNAAADEIVYDS